MQQVSDKSHSISFLRHHSAPYFGEHGRHQTKKIVEEAIKWIELNSGSRDKKFEAIFDALDKYTSKHGIEGELITEVYSLCLAEVTKEFQSSAYNPASKEFNISCDILNLIATKFYDKISIKSELLEQHFVYFFEMIIEYSHVHLRRDDNIQIRDQIHKTFFRIISFHIDASVRRDDCSSTVRHKNLLEILIAYQDFLHKKIQIRDVKSGEEFSGLFHLVFDAFIHFLNYSNDNIVYNKKILSEIVNFIDILINQFSIYIQSDFQTKINELVDSSLCMEFKTNYCLVKNIHVAQSFLKFIHEKESFLLVKMEQSILSNPRLEHCRMPDFNEFLAVYNHLFKKCPEEFQIQTMERLFKHSGNMRTFYFLLENVLSIGTRFSSGDHKTRYILILKNFIGKVKPLFLVHAIKSEDICFDVFLKIASKILHACQDFKNEDSVHVTSICHWSIDLVQKMIMVPDINSYKRDFLLKKMSEFVSSCSRDSIKLTTLKLYEINQFSIENQTKSEFFYQLTKVTSTALAVR